LARERRAEERDPQHGAGDPARDEEAGAEAAAKRDFGGLVTHDFSPLTRARRSALLSGAAAGAGLACLMAPPSSDSTSSRAASPAARTALGFFCMTVSSKRVA